MSSIAHVRDLVPTRDFAVGLDGTVTHAPGVEEQLARAVHYACRMAAQLDTVLDLGTLMRFRTSGATEIDAAVGWGLGGECLVGAHVRTGPPPLPMLPALPAQADPQRAAFVAAQLDATVAETHAGTRATWTVLVRHDLVPLRVLGDLPSEHLPVLCSRTLGMLNGLRGLRGLDASELGSLTLDHARGTLVVAPVGAHALCFFVDLHDTPAVRTAVDRARTLLDGLDLASAAPAAAPAEAPVAAPVAAAGRAVPESEVDWEREEWLEPEFAFPVGARFAGMAPKPPKARRRQGRRGRRQV